MTDINYMRRACRLAVKARGKTSPNPMVGAVIVKGNRVIAEGWHRRCGAEHAETVALEKARGRASGARMYVTLEPCSHYGHTPPCVDRIITSGIKEVVVGMKDPNPLTNGRSIEKLRRAGVKTKVGIFRKEVELMNEFFIKYITEKMPFVAAKCAQSLDGKIAQARGQSKWITSEGTRRYARRLRDEFDAIMVGIDTVLKDDPWLNGSKKARRLKKIVLDSTLRMPPRARLFAGVTPSDCIIATTARAPGRKKIKFLKKGIDVIVCPQRDGRPDLKWLFKELARRGVASILMEGGAHVIGSALREKLVDKMYVYIAPMIFGDQNALSAVVGMHAVDVHKSVRLTDLTFKKINKDILVQGYIRN